MTISRRLSIAALALVAVAAAMWTPGQLGESAVVPGRGAEISTSGCGDGSLGVTAVTVGESQEALDRQSGDISAIGFSSVRLPIEWPRIELSPGTFDWSQIDAQVDSFLAKGVGVLGVVTWAPTFAVPVENQLVRNPAPADPAAFAQFAAEAAQHFDGRISTWEVWNEPNVGAAFGPIVNVDLYSRMLVQSYQRIKAVDPSLTVLTGGTSPTADNATDLSPASFVRELYRLGAGGSFDGVAMHPYSYIPLSNANNVGESGSDIELVREQMVAAGDENKKIWFTEFGVPTGGPTNLTEIQQAQYLVDGISYLRSLPYCAGLFLFDFRDVATGSASQEYNFGLVRSDYTPKASLAAVESIM
ncbi:glycosyl hydrolase [Rhodococcoides trifolii]|uniref:glycosyl hydrolase n=1 Tax=Rhodococcoides trifolii TaxID=908250 RepID=UPI0016685C48|nr:glycosyl hydrolase [Rhodococcus trifolii]